MSIYRLSLLLAAVSFRWTINTFKNNCRLKSGVLFLINISLIIFFVHYRYRTGLNMYVILVGYGNSWKMDFKKSCEKTTFSTVSLLLSSPSWRKFWHKHMPRSSQYLERISTDRYPHHFPKSGSAKESGSSPSKEIHRFYRYRYVMTQNHNKLFVITFTK